MSRVRCDGSWGRPSGRHLRHARLNLVGSYVTIDFIAGVCEDLSNGLDRNSTGCRVPIVSCRGMSSDL